MHIYNNVALMSEAIIFSRSCESKVLFWCFASAGAPNKDPRYGNNKNPEIVCVLFVCFVFFPSLSPFSKYNLT